MRTVTAGEALVLAGLNRTVTPLIEVQNGSGSMIDLSTWMQKATIDQDIDQPVSGATIEFRRENFGPNGIIQSISPFRTDSTINRLNDGVTYSPQLDLNRSVTIKLATTSIGKYAGS